MTERPQILAVDDDARNLLAIEAVLDGLEVDVVRARSGAEALGVLELRDYAVVLLDVHMPGMDGFETARRIRDISATRHIPIIFLTANTDLGRAAQGYAEGGVDYLFKPIVPELLRAKVSVFADLFRKNRVILEMQAREHDRQLGDERRRFDAELLRNKLEQERATSEALAAANRQLETALATAKEALAAREEFMRMASHELNTPITSMRLTLDNVLRRAQDGTVPPEKMLRALTILHSQTEKLTRLAEELLSVVVLEGGRLRLVVREVDLNEVAVTAVEELEEVIDRARCTASVQTTGPVVGTWDPFWIQQAIANLLTNGCKFGAEGPLEVTVSAGEGCARVAVRDHGIGIAAEDHARIFQPFQRAVSPEHYGGLGLGLHIARRIVEGHGGSVRVESAGTGKGATFTIELPR